MTLSPMQLGKATRLQKRGLLLREIAAELDVTFEDVCLALYGANDWRKADGGVDGAGAGRNVGDAQDLDSERLPAVDAGDAVADAVGGTEAREAAPPARAPEPEEAPAAPAAPCPTAEQVVTAELEGGAADAAQVVVAAAPVAAAPELAARPRAAAAALAATGQDSERWYRLVDFDGRSLHGNRRVMTRDKQHFWQGTAEAVAKLKRALPQWQDLQLVEIGGGE